MVKASGSRQLLTRTLKGRYSNFYFLQKIYFTKTAITHLSVNFAPRYSKIKLELEKVSEFFTQIPINEISKQNFKLTNELSEPTESIY